MPRNRAFDPITYFLSDLWSGKGAGHVSETPARPCLFRRSHWSWAPWVWVAFGWESVAGGRFCAGGGVSSAPWPDAGPVAAAAGFAVLWLESELAAGVGAWVWVAA